MQQTRWYVEFYAAMLISVKLEAAFGEVGPLRSCFVVCEKGDEHVCKGYGFVTYSLDADAERAIEHFKKAKFMNKRLVVDYAKPRERGAREGEAEGEDADASSESSQTPEAARKPHVAKVKKDKNPKMWRLIVRNLGWKVQLR